MCGLRVEGLGFTVQGLGLRVQVEGLGLLTGLAGSKVLRALGFLGLKGFEWALRVLRLHS